MIHSKSAIWREGNELLKKIGYPMFLPTHKDEELGKVFMCDFEKVVRFVLAVNFLTKIAIVCAVDLGFSVDAAALTNGTSHIFAGCKNLDPRSRGQDGEFLFVTKDESGREHYRFMQSNSNIYLMVMVYARDGKTLYQKFFKEWFAFINKIKHKGIPYPDENNPKLMPFKVRIPQDCSSIQKSLNMGGACKSCDLFFHFCARTSYGASLYLMKWREGHLWCKRFCLSQADPLSNFFHWEVDEEEEIEKKKQQVKVFLLFEELQSFYLMPDYFKSQILSPKEIKYYYRVNVKFPDSHVEEDLSVKSASRIKTYVSDLNRANDPMHIDFMCATSTGHVWTTFLCWTMN